MLGYRCVKKSVVEVRARSQTVRPLDWRYVNIIEYFASSVVNSDVGNFCISLHLLIATKSVTINNYITHIV